MYKTVICDNVKEQLDEMKKLVLRYNAENPGRFLPPALFCDAAELLEHMDEGAVYDLYMLDASAQGMGGIDIAQKLRKSDGESRIIFTSSAREFAVDAFWLDATHYLLRPLSYAQLAEALDRAFRALVQSRARAVSIKSRDGRIYRVNVADVISVECFGHIQKIACADFELETRDSLQLIRETLMDERFFMVYKGIFVNMDMVKLIENDFAVLCDGRKLPVAKRTMPKLRKKYLEYTANRGK